MTTPINNDETIDGKDSVIENVEVSENVSGFSNQALEATGRKKSFVDTAIPTNTAANPLIFDFSAASSGDANYPTTGTPSQRSMPSLCDSVTQDRLRVFLRKYWIADQSILGLNFYNKDTHRQGIPIGSDLDTAPQDTNSAMPAPPFTLHVKNTDIEHSYESQGLMPEVQENNGVPSSMMCYDKLEDPRIKPGHADHQDFIFHALGMSKHQVLQGDETLERIVFSYSPSLNPENPINHLGDWSIYLGAQHADGAQYPESAQTLMLPVYSFERDLNPEDGRPSADDHYQYYQAGTTNVGAGENNITHIKDIYMNPVLQRAKYTIGAENDIKQKTYSWELQRIARADTKYTEGKFQDHHKLKTYHDHVFSFSTPSNKKSLDEDNAKIKTMIFDLNQDYQMSMPAYEEGISWQEVPESLLPSLYMFLSEMNNQDLDDATFLDHITLNGQVMGEHMQNMLGENGGFLKAEGGGIKSISAYLKSYAATIRAFSNTAAAQELVQKYSRTGFTFDSMLDIMSDARARKFLFPMNIGISFNTDKKTHIAELMKEARLTCVFSKAMSFGQAVVTKDLPFNSFHEEAKQFRDLNTGEKKVESILNSQQSSFRSWNLNEFVQAIDDLGPGIYGDTAMTETDYVMLGYGDSIDIMQPENYFYRYLMTTLFSSKAKKFIKKKTRTYLDLLKGKQAYNETLFYKIEKYRKAGQENYQDAYTGDSDDIDPTDGILVQTILLPNSNELDVFEYIDTQVKYGYKYNYRVMAYQLVVGTEYQLCRTFPGVYLPIQKSHDDSGTDTVISGEPIYEAVTHVVSRPSPRIIEVPYFGDFSSDYATACVIDDPPVPPDYEIVPYKGYANKVLINFAPNTGELEAEPIVIEEHDFKTFSDAYLAQGINPAEGPIRFSSDEPVHEYEVFRCSKAPSSYQEFNDKMIKVVQYGPANVTTSCVDSVKSNKKYYYTFRARDSHGWVSNPTPVIQVELVENDGAVYLLQEEYHFPKPEDDLVATKDMKKYIYLQPRFSQIQVDYSRMQTSTTDSAYDMPEGELPVLGVHNEALMNRSFKMRVKSKNTGKVFDVNFKFVQDHLPVDQNTLAWYMSTLAPQPEEAE